MKYLSILFAVLPALIMAQDGGGSPNPNPIELAEDNPAIVGASATASSAAVPPPPADSALPAIAAPIPLTSALSAVQSGSAAVPSASGNGTGNSTDASPSASAPPGNSTGGAELHARTMPIAELMAAAGVVGAMVL